MKAKHFILTLSIMLVAFLAGPLPIHAWGYYDWDYDDGGGTYDFFSEYDEWGTSSSHFYPSNLMDFRTEKPYNFDNDQFAWEYAIRVLNPKIYIYNVSLEGVILVVTQDGVSHQVATWSKTRSESSNVVAKITDSSYGPVSVSKIDDGHNIRVRFMPSQISFNRGVKKIIMKSRFVHKNSWESGWIQYEKDINVEPLFGTNSPLPEMKADWAENGGILYHATNVPDKIDNPKFEGVDFQVFANLPAGYRMSTNINITHSEYTGNYNITRLDNGKLDITYVSRISLNSPLATAFTTPIFVNTHGWYGIYTSSDQSTYEDYQQPFYNTVLKPFTHPATVNVEFDKWNKRNTITWTRVESVQGYNGSGYQMVDCRYDGKWYVIRYEKGNLEGYALVGSLDGEAETLQLTDDGCDYEKDYIYRVIFLPSIIDEEFKYNLDEPLPCDNSRYGDGAMLWKEAAQSTKLEMPIKLSQDRTYIDAVRLTWEYCVQPSGQNWTVEYSPVGENAWRVLDNSLNVDTEKSQAFFDTEGSVCDLVDYRVKTTYADKDFYSNVITGNLPAGSYISEVKASTGTEEKNVIVKWRVERADVYNDIYYRVLRRQVGSEEWTLLTDEIHGTATEYTYTDDRVMAGSYYEYTVEAYGAKCEDQLVKTDEVITPGFSQARGTITGHISYGTGTAVAGVRVNLVKSSADESADQPQFLSRYIEGEGKGLLWTADSAKYAGVLNGQKELTLQMWARPVAGNTASFKPLMVLNGAIELGVKTQNGTDYYLYAYDFTNLGKQITEFTDLKFDKYDFTHVAATYSKGIWTFYVGNDTLLSKTLEVSDKNWKAIENANGSPTLSIGGSNRLTDKVTGTETFTGFVDDIRLWNRALTAKELNANYTRIQGGTEDGLILYWPLDEGISINDYAFDVARQDGIYQLNHPEVGVNARPSATVPSSKYLALYGLTDAEGDYIIRGIPFQQGGTNYKLAPVLGIHEFNPNTRSMFISPTSLTANNIDFEDVSSFPMRGHIYYAGTNIPAEGIMFYVDGELVSGNGEVKKTDSDGYYEISVPIGNHYVEAKLDGHTMVSGGRFPTTGTFNFNRAVQYDFADSTLVNFVGRVGGGERNDTLAVGFGASRNNIGMATIMLKLNNESFSFNCQDDHISDATAIRSWESDTTSIKSRSWSGIGTDSKYIFIRTDSLTGEFSAMLPPLKYITKSIKVDSIPDIEFTVLPEIDLTKLKEFKDSLLVPTENGDSVWNYYSYNTKHISTYFAKPEVIYWQKNGNGAFGENILKKYSVSSTEKLDITDIWTRENDGSVKYNYGYPIFDRKKKYWFCLRGYEVYVNYDSGTAVADTIPLVGQIVTIENEMSDKQSVVAEVIDPSVTDLKVGDIYHLKSNQLMLNENGMNELEFTTGIPNITAPYTRQFRLYFERNKRTYVGKELNAIVLGEITDGNNFVTAGPDIISMVLRDPPGSKSRTIWKTGTVKTKIENTTTGFYENEAVTAELIWGIDLKSAYGMGVMIISNKEATTTAVVGEHGVLEWLTKKENTWVYTTGENISTSTGSKYVGSNGDVFIGTSHNYIIGTCRKLGFHLEADGIRLGLKDAISMSDSIHTDFAYSVYDIKNTMIPKLIDTRNALLEYKDSISAVNYVNTSDKDVYLTWLKPEDPNYGKDSTYVWKISTKGKSQDMVLHYNEAIRLWRKAISDNEKDKITAFNDYGNFFKENRSFDGGTSYTYTERWDTTKVEKEVINASLGFVGELKSRIGMNAAMTFGANLQVKTETGYKKNTETSDFDDNVKTYAEFDYELNDGNPGTDFTVDIYESPSNWSNIFLLRGGQSYNPYEGQETTTEYEPEKNHIISYGTEQMEQPIIAISTDGNVGAQSAILSDVPSGQSAQFTLHLTNGTRTNQDVPFTYTLMLVEYSDSLGLEVLMDGVPLNNRGIYIPAGETIKKIITVRQTDQSILDYNDVQIWFASQYQPAKIHNGVKLSVHFTPSSSPVDLSVDEPVLNIETLKRNEGNLMLKLANFNRKFKNLKNIGLQYRYEGNTQWNTIHTYVTAKTDSLNEKYSTLPDASIIRYYYNMADDNLFPQGTYTFRAFTTTPYGNNPNDAAIVYSDEVTVVKDNVRPRNLTTPAPANGVLRYGDDISIEFNEDIVPGLVSDRNIIVTSKLNSHPVNHDVSLQLMMPFTDDARTTNPVFLNGDFSLEFWMKNSTGGTVLHQGAGTANFSLGLDGEGHAVVNLAGMKFTSEKTVPLGVWTYIVMSYKASEMTFDLLAQYGTESVEMFRDEKISQHELQAIDYADDNYLYLGGFWGFIHEMSLYSIYRDVYDAAATKYQAKDGYVYGLVNYWPMNEGHGTIAYDMRHTHDFIVSDAWQIDNTNYGLSFSEAEYVQADITRANTSRGDSYAIEFWYESKTQNGEVVFETCTPTIEGDKLSPNAKLRLRYDDEQNLVLDYGTKSQTVATCDMIYHAKEWQHIALNVVRGQSAGFYYNGQRTAVIAENDMPMLEGSAIVFGRGGKHVAIDELRIWKATLTEDRLLSEMYNTLDTADVYSRGLVAYYPFEKPGVVNGVSDWVSTLEDMAPGSVAGDIHVEGKLYMTSITPPLKNAPIESRIIAKPVASDRKLVIRLEEGAGIKARDIEGTTLNITVDKIHDMHGNESAPTRWTTFVQLNTLKWMKDSVNIIKPYGDEYTFDVNIENRGGNTEYYTLYNLPIWLTLVDSERSDDVDPLKTKTLRFKVNPLVAVGNYDVTIGLQGNNEIMEPLRIVMKVRGEKPAWNVDPNAYENSMSIVGQIYVNGILMSNNESILAAFIGDECRGMVSPKQVRGAAYVAMSVYGTAQQMVNGLPEDLDKNQPVTFRIWDAATGLTYTNVSITMTDGTVTDTLAFDPTKSYGTFDKPLIFTKSNLVAQSLNIKNGWNWLSFGVEPGKPKVMEVFKDFVTWNAQLKDQSTGVAYCRGSYWAGNLKEVRSNTMYKLQLTRMTNSKDIPTPFVVNGQQVKLSETPVTLGDGWNWIAYTPMTTLPIAEALAGANPQYGDQVKSQTAFAYYGPYGWEGNLEALESGRGYLYFSTDTVKEKQFVYPTISATLAKDMRLVAAKPAPESSAFPPVDPTDYPDNMAMVIMLTDGGIPITTGEVAAFVNGECRGAAFADDDLYYLLISGEGSGQPMEIRACINGTIQTVCTTLKYSSDGSIGTPWEPFVIDITDPSGISDVYGQSMANGIWYTLQGIRYGTTKPKEPGVYIYNGQKVVIRRARDKQ